MSNSKRKCKNCSEYVRDYIVINNMAFCNIDGATSYAFKNKETGKKIKHKQEKKNYQLYDRKIRKAALKKSCHEYIRLRDKDKSCICCNEPLGDSFHAGHWLESGNNPKIRFDEDNIHGQRIYCNTYKGGDSGDYEKNLRSRIGNERVDRLLSMKGGIDKMTADKMLDLENYYKKKVKKMTPQEGKN